MKYQRRDSKKRRMVLKLPAKTAIKKNEKQKVTP